MVTEDTDVEFKWSLAFRGTLCLDDLEMLAASLNALPVQRWILSGQLSAGNEGEASVSAPTLESLLAQRYLIRKSTTLTVQAGRRVDEYKEGPASVTVRLERLRNDRDWQLSVYAGTVRLRDDFDRMVRGLGELVDRCQQQTWTQRIAAQHPWVAPFPVVGLSLVGFSAGVIGLLSLTDGNSSPSARWLGLAMCALALVSGLSVWKLERLQSWTPPTFDLLRRRPELQGSQPPKFLARDVSAGIFFGVLTSLFSVVVAIVLA